MPVLAFAEDRKNITGKEWLGMSGQEKYTCTITTMQALQQKGIPFCRAPNIYAGLIDSKLSSAPNLQSNQVGDILTRVVYEREPGARDVLDRAGIKTKV